MTSSSDSIPEPTPVENCGVCGTVLDIAEMLPLTVVECPGCSSAITVLQRFGQYRLDGLLGTGGMGAVYKAFDVALQRHLALKILQRNWSHDALLTAQFEKEAALTARVNHPNVVRVYSTGKAHGMFYIAMELVDRGSLDALMEDKGRLAETEVLHIGIQVAEGLEAATKAGLIHRDIKPGNILFGENGRAKIVDFGLALQSNQTEANLGEIWGTPFYVSPETLASKPEDFRSDMYALGSSLWHALTGSPPYPSTSTSIHELLHLKKRPVDLAAAVQGLNPRTVAALNRTVAPDAGNRFPDYATLAAELKLALAELQSPEKQADSAETKASGIWRYAAILVAFGGLSCGGYWWWNHRDFSEDPALSSAEQSLLTNEERLSRACALLTHPAHLDVAMRRLELVSRSPELRPELQLWAAVALGTGHGLRGDPAKQTAALDALHGELPPLWKNFLQRLKSAAAISRAGSSESALSAEEQGVFLLWRALAKVAQGNPESALTLLQKSPSVAVPSDRSYVAPLLALREVMRKNLETLLALEKEFLAPGKPEDVATRTQRAETFRSELHPLLADAQRVLTLIQNAKAEVPRTPEHPPTPDPPKSPTPPTPPPTPPPTSLPPPLPTAAQPLPTARPTSPPVSSGISSEALRAQVSPQILSYQFKEARSKTGLFNPQSPRELAQKSLLLRQVDEVETLFRWCLQQINFGGTLPSPIMRNGAAFKSDPVKADERTLSVRPDPTASLVPIEWKDISPLFLVKLLQFRGGAIQNPTQRAELLWGAGTVHQLLGSKKSAVDFFEEAARINPAYRAALPSVLETESTP